MPLPKLHIKQLALLFAASQVGEKEDPKGSNKGPMVNQFLKVVGLDPGYAWCMAFVYWCYAMAAKALGITNPLARNASVLGCWAKTLPTCIINVADARANPLLISEGDIIIFRHGNATGHTGLVERIECKGGVWIIYTIEGNTNTDGSRDGYEVERKQRLLTDEHLIGFIHF